MSKTTRNKAHLSPLPIDQIKKEVSRCSLCNSFSCENPMLGFTPVEIETFREPLSNGGKGCTWSQEGNILSVHSHVDKKTNSFCIESEIVVKSVAISQKGSVFFVTNSNISRVQFSESQRPLVQCVGDGDFSGNVSIHDCNETFVISNNDTLVFFEHVPELDLYILTSEKVMNRVSEGFRSFLYCQSLKMYGTVKYIRNAFGNIGNLTIVEFFDQVSHESKKTMYFSGLEMVYIENGEPFLTISDMTKFEI